MGNSWQAGLSEVIDNKLSLYDVSEFLLKLKNKGVSQYEVSNWLQQKRHEVLSEDTEDWILEILDIVFGYCQNQYRVW